MTNDKSSMTNFQFSLSASAAALWPCVSIGSGPKNQGKSSQFKVNQGKSSHFETFFLRPQLGRARRPF
jgi:hypothetical protein